MPALASSHRSLVVLFACSALAVAGCGSGSSAKPATPSPTTLVAGAGTQAAASAAVNSGDSEESKSFPAPAGATGGPSAPAPSAVKAGKLRKPSASGSSSSSVSPGAPSDAEVRAELAQMTSVVRTQRRAVAASGHGVTLDSQGLASALTGTPAIVARVIAGANAIAHYPYVYGGGHASLVDSAYDCSSSLSYALAAGGLLNTSLVSGELAKWGDPGPGRWITIYANDGHTFMYVGGLRYDTSGRDGPLGSRWQTAPRSLAGFTVRHPPGL